MADEKIAIPCPECGGKRGRKIWNKDSTNPMTGCLSWLPCQTCNLASFGFSDDEIADILTERALLKTQTELPMNEEEILRGLTKAQRKAVLSGGYNDDDTLRGKQRPMFYHLTELGLFSPKSPLDLTASWDIPLTPLGRRIQQLLQNQES